MRDLLIACVAASVVTLPLAAQGTFIVPSKAAANQPGAIWNDSAPQIYPLWGSTGTTTVGRAQ